MPDIDPYPVDETAAPSPASAESAESAPSADSAE